MKSMLIKNRLITTSLTLLAAAGLSCKQEPAPRGASAGNVVTVALRPATMKSVQRFVEITGTLYGTEDAVVSAKVAGRVVAIEHDMGDRAKPGETLAQIDRTDYELTLRQKELAVREVLSKLGLEALPSLDFDPTIVPTVQQARLKAANEEAKYNRGKQLHEQQPPLISDQDFADLKTAYEVAKSDYDVALLTARSLANQARSLAAQADMARQTMNDALIAVPNPGNMAADHTYAVATRMVSIGEYVKEGTNLFRLVDDDPVKLRAAVPERFSSEVKVGQRVRVHVEAYSDEFIGKLTRINPQIDPTNRTFTIEVLVPNEKRLLMPGAFARAAVETKVDPSVVFVPQEAIVQFAGVTKVFTVDAALKAVEHAVQPGDTQDGMVEVLKGLEGTESVVIEGASRLATGVDVKVKPQS